MAKKKNIFKKISKTIKSPLGKVLGTALGLGAVVAVTAAVTKAQQKTKNLEAIAKQVKVTKSLSVIDSAIAEVAETTQITTPLKSYKITMYQKFVKKM